MVVGHSGLLENILTDTPESLEILASEGAQVSVWDGRPFQTLSLLEMIPFYAALLYEAGTRVTEFLRDLEEQEESRGVDAPLNGGEIKTAEDLIRKLNDECDRANLKRALERLEGLAWHLPQLGSSYTLRSFAWELEELNKAIGNDLAERLFLYIPLEEAKYHEHGKHRHELLKREAAAKFPEANKELIAAGNCYATDNHTACVFHCMRAVEYGLRYMARRRLRITLPKKRHIDLEEWGKLIDNIENKIKEIEKTRKRTPQRERDLEFYHGAASQFRHFKNAWRNHVMHTRRSYDDEEGKDEARRVLVHVAEFMEHISSQRKK